MIVPAVRQTADWLAHVTTGVNAQLASVPRDVGDPAPPAVTVADETREAWVARGAVNRKQTGTGPLLLVRGPEDVEVPIFGTQGAGGEAEIDVRVLYVRRAPATGSTAVDSDDAVRDCYQTLRAAARAIALQYTTQQAAPSRNSVDLRRPTVRLLRGLAPLVEGSADGEMITGILVLTYPAVDPWAMAAIS